MRFRRARGALIATACCFAVPFAGAGVAHALTVPGVSVALGGVHVAVPDTTVSLSGSHVGANVAAGSASVGVNVTTPSVVPPVASPIPEPPALPAPVGPVVNQVAGQGNDTINHVTSPSSGSGSGSGSSGGGSASGGGSGSGSSGAGSGSATPSVTGGRRNGRASGGGSGAATPAKGKGRSGAGNAGGSGKGVGGGKPIAARVANGSGGARAKATDQNDSTNDGGGSPSAVAQVINRIERVIPGPIWALIGLLALLAGGFALRSQLVSRRAARLERQREELLGDVGLLQRALLPDVPGGLRGIEASVAYRPAEGPAAGGDFYDVFELDDHRTAIIVGDVCGHGRQALAVTALMRYTLRAYLGAGFEPRLALKVAGRTIDGDPDGELTTVVLAVYDAREGTLSYACAGHEPPIVLGASAHEPVTVSSSPPLGGFMATGHRQTTLPFPPGSAACFFTDGLVEARLGEKMIGRGRLKELVTELAPGEGAQLLLNRLAASADRAPDDMAACLVRTRDDAVEARGIRVEELEADAAELRGERVLEFLTACGIPAPSAAEALDAARAKASEFGGAVLRVHVTATGGRVEIVPSEPATLPVPSLAARRAGALEIPA